MCRWLLVVLLAAISIGLGTGCNEHGNGAFYIGVPELEWSKRAIALALEEINSQGGPRGRELRVIYSAPPEGEGMEEAAASMADRLASDNRVSAIIGHTETRDSLSAGHIYNRHGVVQIIPGASSPLLTKLGPWSFRLSASDEAQGRFLAETAWEKLGFRQAVIIFINNDYGKQLARTINARFTELGGEVCDLGWYGQNDLEPLDSLVARIAEKYAASQCPNMFFAGDFFGLERVLNTLKEKDAPMAVLCGDAAFAVSRAEQVENLAGGARIYCSTFYYPGANDEKVKTFREAFVKRYGEEPESMDALSYDAVYLLAGAFADAGGDRTAIRNYLRRVGDSEPPFAGATGTISFLSSGESRRPVTVVEYCSDLTLLAREEIAPPER
jgi:branched-chain amino acid transport system substrate-binding protein